MKICGRSALANPVIPSGCEGSRTRSFDHPASKREPAPWERSLTLFGMTEIVRGLFQV
jgi:hypothetical protein